MIATPLQLKCFVLLVLAGAMLGGCAYAAPFATLEQGNTGRIEFRSSTFSPPRRILPLTDVAEPAVIGGDLTLPPGRGRLPAVVVTHGSAGITPVEEGWAAELNRMGIATFLVDRFTGRGIPQTYTGQYPISTGSEIVDMYRALELLATHPRIDPSRIALMGFSQGGRVTLWASYPRFQRRWMKPGGPRFAAYLAFYPGCKWYTLTGDEEATDRPIRIFHGAADDWWPAAACQDYVARMKRAGKDIAVTEYPDAHHSFDNPRLPAYQRLGQALSPGRCAWVEQPDGRFIDPDTGQPPAGPGAPCMSRGATIGYNASAHRQAIRDVKVFLSKTFRIDQ